MKTETAKRIGMEFGVSDRHVKRWQGAGMPYSKELVADAEGRARWTCLYSAAEVWGWLTEQGLTRQGAVKAAADENLECHGQTGLSPEQRDAWLSGFYHGTHDATEYLIDDPDSYDAAHRAARPARLRQLERLKQLMGKDETE